MIKYLNLLFISALFILSSVLSNELKAQVKQFVLYGYGQVDFAASSKKGSNSGFDQRRINLIGEFFPDEKLRILSDVEYEGGTDISYGDSSYGGTVKLSRAWLEYTLLPELKVRAGKMLTSFGLYNLVHDASASYFPLEPPIMYSKIKLNSKLKPQRLYSKYNLGLEFLGTINLNNDGSQIEYSIGIGNGRGAKGDGTDINNGRSLSTRFIYRPASIPGLQVGTSFYFDKNYTGLGGIQNDLEYTTAVDIQYENNLFQFQLEGLAANYEIENGARRTTGIGYIQVVYTMLDIVSPYLNYSAVMYDMKSGETNYTRINIGVNFSVTPHLYLKSEIQFHEAEEELNDESFNVFKISAAFAF